MEYDRKFPQQFAAAAADEGSTVLRFDDADSQIVALPVLGIIAVPTAMFYVASAALFLTGSDLFRSVLLAWIGSMVVVVLVALLSAYLLPAFRNLISNRTPKSTFETSCRTSSDPYISNRALSSKG